MMINPQYAETIMKKKTAAAAVLIGIVTVIFLAGCSSKEDELKEKLLGNWNQSRNRNYILLVIKADNTWDSSIKIADATSRIVESKGRASGIWHIEDNHLVFTVNESDIEDVWKPGSAEFNEIVRLEDGVLELKTSTGRTVTWKQNRPEKKKQDTADDPSVLDMAPIVVNLNKNRSADKDRYFCLKMELQLKELMPGTKPPGIHPRVRDAAIVFLSSMVFDDVKDFDKVKEQKKKLVDVLNPYMDGAVRDIKITHVLIASSISKVEEFVIEHTYTGETEAGDGEADAEKMETEENG